MFRKIPFFRICHMSGIVCSGINTEKIGYVCNGFRFCCMTMSFLFRLSVKSLRPGNFFRMRL